MGKVYAYCRVAREEDGNLDRQCEEVKEFCNKNGLNLHKIWSDEGSGLNQDRWSLQRMIRSLRKGDVVVVKNESRISRDMVGFADTMQIITGRGVKVEFIDKHESLDTIGVLIGEWFKNRF
jgi:DNA invertase Pin-like site-specific DNA recombinase